MKTPSNPKINTASNVIAHHNEDTIETTENVGQHDWLLKLHRKQLQSCAQHLDVELAELKAWIGQFGAIPIPTQITLLRIAQEHHLDPLKGQILWIASEDQSWQVHISIDGWIMLMHRHPAFAGVSFAISPDLENGLPIWMECSIYRHDQSQPITVREYLTEVKGDGEIWQKMPRRMLRHKVLQQCARIGLGLVIPEIRPGLKNPSNISDKDTVNTGQVNGLNYNVLGAKDGGEAINMGSIPKNVPHTQSDRLKILLEK